MSHRISSPQSTGAQRAARAITNPNEPTACRMCGSIYFMEMPAQMYSMGGYCVRSVSTTPMKLFICPCGEIQTPAGLNSGNQAGGERDLFAQSLAAALAYRAKTGVDAAAQAFAGVHELRELEARIDLLQDQINQLSGIEPLEPLRETVGAVEDDLAGEIGNEALPQQKVTKDIDGDLVAPPPMATGARGPGQTSSGCPQPGQRHDTFLSGG